MKSNYYFLIFLTLITIVFSCGKDINTDNDLAETNIEFRNSGDLIDLLGTSCVPSSIIIGGGCNDTLFVDTLIIDDLDDYPGCAFTIVFQTRYCEFGGFKDVTVGDFQILDHDCAAFSIDLNNAYNQSIFSSFIIDFELSVWEKIEEYLIEENVLPGTYMCGQGVYFNINFIRASCYRYMSYDIRPGLSVATKLACGSECCERHTRVCRMPDGTIISETYDVTNPFLIDCSDPSFLIDPPLWLNKGQYSWLTYCMVTCPDE